MSADAKDIEPRILALEQAFCGLALISAANYAGMNEIGASEAVQQFRSAIEGASFATDASPDTRLAAKTHLKRLFDQVAAMAVTSVADA